MNVGLSQLSDLGLQAIFTGVEPEVSKLERVLADVGDTYLRRDLVILRGFEKLRRGCRYRDEAAHKVAFLRALLLRLAVEFKDEIEEARDDIDAGDLATLTSAIQLAANLDEPGTNEDLINPGRWANNIYGKLMVATNRKRMLGMVVIGLLAESIEVQDRRIVKDAQVA